eukprot:7748322-Alexandrium_andersonii.AAC.1
MPTYHATPVSTESQTHEPHKNNSASDTRSITHIEFPRKREGARHTEHCKGTRRGLNRVPTEAGGRGLGARVAELSAL